MKITKNKFLSIIKKYNKIYITGHREVDLDALASSITMSHILSSFGIDNYIILDDNKLEHASNDLYNEVKNNFNFVKSYNLSEKDTKDTLIIVVDTNKKNLLSKRIFSLFNEFLVIDHHNTGRDTIVTENLFIHNDVSSVCELLCFLLIELNIKIDNVLANALLSGIILDTNRFMIKTDKKTIEAVHFLYQNGAEASVANCRFNETLTNYKAYQRVILNADTIGNIAYSKGLNRVRYRREDLAKVADTLLGFKDIQASVVVGNLKDKSVGISIRSVGGFDASEMASYFGGGGSHYEAAANIKGEKLGEVFKRVKEYLEKTEVI